MGGGSGGGFTVYPKYYSDAPAEKLSVDDIRSLFVSLSAFKAPGHIPAYERRNKDVRDDVSNLFLPAKQKKDLRFSLGDYELYKDVRADLKNAMQTAHDPQVRIELMDIHYYADLELVAGLLDDPNGYVRDKAVEHVARFGQYKDNAVAGLELLAPMVRDGGVSQHAADGAVEILQRASLQELQPHLPRLRKCFTDEANRLRIWNMERRERYEKVIETLDHVAKRAQQPRP